MSYRYLYCLLCCLITGQAVAEDNWEFTGTIGLESRWFYQDALFDGQDEDLLISPFIQPEIRWESDDGAHRVTFVGFARADSQDSERSRGDVRELYYAYEADDWDILVGVNKVFWGVTEIRHLVDIINQADLVEDIDEEDELGQPMVNLNLQRDWGRISLFALPFFRQRTFPGESGRLRVDPAVNDDAALFESGAEEFHFDYAIRYSHFFGDVDVGLYWFDGTSREPLFVPNPDPSTDELLPFYQQMQQVGLDLQYTTGAWLWKLEAIGRDTSTGTFGAAVAGFEYTFYQMADTAADIGILTELLYDGRGADAPFTLFDNDVFIGTRLALNDSQDTAILAGVAIDVENGEAFINLEAERRFGDSIVAELRWRAFAGGRPPDPIAFFENDDYVQLRLNWYY